MHHNLRRRKGATRRQRGRRRGANKDETNLNNTVFNVNPMPSQTNNNISFHIPHNPTLLIRRTTIDPIA